MIDLSPHPWTDERLIQLLNPRTVQFVRYFARGYPGRTALMVGLLIVAGVAEGVGLITLLPLLESATGQDEATRSGITQTALEGLQAIGVPPGLGPLLTVIVVAMALKALFLWLATKQVGYTVSQVATDLRLRLIRALLKARWSFFAQKPTGYFANALSSEATRASHAYEQVCKAMAGAIQIGVYLAVVVVISWQVAVIALIVGPIVIYALRGFVRMSRHAGDEQTQVMRRLIGRITSLLPGIKPIKAMAREQHLLPFLEAETEGFNRARQQTVFASESLRAFQEPVIVLVLAVGLYGAVTIGDAPAAAVIVAAVLFYRVMTTAGNLQMQYQAVTVNESAFWSLVDTVEEAEAAEERDRPDGAPAPSLEEGIELRDVSFSYGEESVLASVRLEIPAGELVTVVGPSGAGKTTLVDLVAGLLEPDDGEILVDGVPLSEIDRTTWRDQVGYVPQEVLLFNDTVYQNVTLGDDGFTRDEVEHALRAAGAWEFVSATERGMDHEIGERGAQISGGQRQRIAIARALLGGPRLLILDEATTALDPDTERRICDTLVGLRRETTILAISHQPALAEAASRIYQVANGSVVRLEAGPEAIESGAF